MNQTLSPKRVVIKLCVKQVRPYSFVPLITLYNQNRSTFQKAGVTLNDLFNGYDMEISDNYDNYELGARFHKDWFDMTPAVFYSKQDHLLTTVYNPRVNLSCQQNIGKATGYGLELETNRSQQGYHFFC